MLATVLFTDVVGSTERASALGDRQWRELLDLLAAEGGKLAAHHRVMPLDTAGDGFLASFDGPARAIRAARAIADKVRLMGLDVRAGLHTCECEIIGPKLTGIAVHMGARIAALAQPGEVLVSREGSRGRLGAALRRPRRARPQGRAGGMARLRGRPCRLRTPRVRRQPSGTRFYRLPHQRGLVGA